MDLCRLFGSLSRLTWSCIEISRAYCHSTNQGLKETSITDFLLLQLHARGRPNCVVYLPKELTTGADLELIVVGPALVGMHFRLQAKQLRRDERYHDLMRANRNGYQVDVLCRPSAFFPCTYSTITIARNLRLTGHASMVLVAQLQLPKRFVPTSIQVYSGVLFSRLIS
jgi:hypothetical protein